MSPGDGASEGSSPSSQSDQFPFLKPFTHRPAPDQSIHWVRDVELMFVNLVRVEKDSTESGQAPLDHRSARRTITKRGHEVPLEDRGPKARCHSYLLDA